jgi:hypothetical protein
MAAQVGVFPVTLGFRALSNTEEGMSEMTDTVVIRPVRVELLVYPDDASAVRLLEHLGFAPEGVKCKFSRRQGRLTVALMMARIRDE